MPSESLKHPFRQYCTCLISWNPQLRFQHTALAKRRSAGLETSACDARRAPRRRRPPVTHPLPQGALPCRPCCPPLAHTAGGARAAAAPCCCCCRPSTDRHSQHSIDPVTLAALHQSHLQPVRTWQLYTHVHAERVRPSSTTHPAISNCSNCLRPPSGTKCRCARLLPTHIDCANTQLSCCCNWGM